MTDRRPKVLISEEDIARRVAELAERISRDYESAGELVLVGVLKGAFIFLADLARRLTIPRTVEFIALSSYGAEAEATGEVRLVMDLRTSIAGKHVLVVEDIVDTGHTLAYLMRLLAARGPASLEACALVRKPDRLQAPVKLAYLGFDIPDRWVVGYGLDLGERNRTLPYIGWVESGPAG
jgi:hypoxanthine phosphoribosyltransferase